MKFVQGSATVRTARRGSGVLEVAYTGVITPALAHTVRGWTLEAIKGAPAAVLCFTEAVLGVDRLPEIDGPSYACAPTPAALVVRHDQYEVWQEFSDRLMRETGILRALFLESHQALAHRWAEAEALAASAESRLTPRSALACVRPYRGSRQAGWRAGAHQG